MCIMLLQKAKCLLDVYFTIQMSKEVNVCCIVYLSLLLVVSAVLDSFSRMNSMFSVRHNH